MAEKQRGRPKRVENIDKGQVIEAKKAPSKVVEAKTETKSEPKIKIRPSQRNRGLHTIIVRGKERQATKATYEALRKDPKLEVTLPKGSLLVEPDIDKPCEDC